MQVLEASENLVHEKLNMLIGQRLIRFDDLAEIRLHQLGNHVDLVELLERLGLEDGLDRQNIVVVQKTLDFELSQRSQSEDFVLKSLLNLLDCNQIVRLLFILVLGSDDDSVSARADWVDNLVVFGELKARAKNFVGLGARARWRVVGTERLNLGLISCFLVHRDSTKIITKLVTKL